MQTTSEQKFLKAFGKNVAALRKARGVTQQQLAEDIGVSVVTVAYIETGKQWVRPKTLDRIAKSLKVSASDLLRGV
jgi:transcriptional regulator with XRE-family HTH domain